MTGRQSSTRSGGVPLAGFEAPEQRPGLPRLELGLQDEDRAPVLEAQGGEGPGQPVLPPCPGGGAS
jgi:hypothetical protein